MLHFLLAFAMSLLFTPAVRLTIDNDLSNNSVWSICQDSDGYMWFGTKDGLNRYDGVAFKTYRCVDGDSLSLGNNFVRSLLRYDERSLWVGTDDGLYVYDMDNDHFTSFRAGFGACSRVEGSISSMIYDSHGNVWASSINRGLYKYCVASDSLTLFNPEKEGNDALDEIWDLCEDEYGRIWFAGMGGKVGYYEMSTGRIHALSIPAKELQIRDLQINSLYYDAYMDELWMGSLDDGVIIYDVNSSLWRRGLTHYKEERLINIHSICGDSPNTLMLACDNGLIEIDRNGQCSMLDCAEQYSQGNASIFSVYKDHEGGLWLGTYYYGLIYIRPNRDAIKHFYSSVNEINNQSNVVSCFARHNDYKVWVGSNNHGISLFDKKSEEVKDASLRLKSKNIKALYDDGKKLWVAYYNDGVECFDIASSRPIAIADQLANTLVYSFHKSGANELYIGTQSGLLLYNERSKSVTQLDWAGAARIYDIKEDAVGQIWLASFGEGLISYNPINGRIGKYSKQNGLPSDRVVCIAFDQANNIWCATENGIAIINPIDARVQVLRDSDGLPNNIVHSILEDRQGRIWASTNSGLCCIDPKDYSMRSYYSSDGLQSNQFSPLASYLFDDGAFLFGGINGFNMIEPQLLMRRNESTPRLTLRSPRIKRNQGELNFAYNEASINMEAVVLSFASPHRNTCSYIMEGLDEQWQDIHGLAHIRYNLAPGHYVLRVRGANSDNTMVAQERVLKINVRRHPMLSWVAIICYVILLLATCFLIIYLIYRHYQSIHAKEMYDSKINFFTNIVHEIRTPLSLIKAPLEQVIDATDKNSPQMGNLIAIEHNTERLYSLVNQLLDFRKMGSNSYVFHFAQQDINKVVAQCCDTFRSTCAIRGIDYRVEDPEESVVLRIDAEAITKLVSNLLSNAVKFTKDQISVKIGHDDKTYKILVRNNGEPIDDKYNTLIFTPFFQIKDGAKSYHDGTGIGLSLSKYIVEMHNGKISHYVDDEGFTVFCISIPYERGMKAEELSQPISSIKEEPTSSDAQLAKASVLCVDDNMELVDFLKTGLSSHYKVFTAGSGAEALEVLGHELVDIILCDIMMDDVDGFELCKRVRSNTMLCHIPIILLSAQTDESYKRRGLECGCDAYMEKPFSVKVLRLQIDSLLKNRNAIRKMYMESPLLPVRSLAKNKNDVAFLEQLNTVILANISSGARLQDVIADELSMSKSNLRRKLKAISGMPPGEYIQLIRLKKAAELIKTTDYRINEIAYMVGFNTPSYFSKCFYEQFKILPKDYAGHE